MPDYDVEAVHRDAIEYYRLTLALHKKGPHAPETAKADEAVLAMVRETPDVLEMNKQMMEGGLSFRAAPPRPRPSLSRTGPSRIIRSPRR